MEEPMAETEGNTTLEVGDDAPDFTLSSSLGAPVSLSEYRGKMNVCLYFYPADNTPGCTRQLSAARDDAARYIEADVARLGINPGSLESHQRFVERHDFDFPLLVDADLQVARAYGAVRPDTDRVQRTVYLIDKDGNVAFVERGSPSTDTILQSIEP